MTSDRLQKRIEALKAEYDNDPPHFYEWQPVFLLALMQQPNVSRAARVAGISYRTPYRHRNKNEAFSEAWAEAVQVGVDRLEEEMWRRAVEGFEKPITYQGEIMDTYREYSDTLAIFLAKAHRPEKFRDRYDVTTGGDKMGTVHVYLPDNDRGDAGE